LYAVLAISNPFWESSTVEEEKEEELYALSRFMLRSSINLQLRIANMLGANVVSDSQESALMDDETYKDIEKTL